MKTFFQSIVTLAFIAVLCSCGSSSSSSTATNALSAATPALGITSPTATSSSSSASLRKHSAMYEAVMGIPSLKSLFNYFGFAVNDSKAAESTAPTDVKDYATTVSELSAKLTADPTTSASTVELTAAAEKTFQGPCYGPSFTENLANNGGSTGATVDHPSGDSGMMYATESDTKTQACSAAQLNALIGGGSAKFAREALELLAVMLAKANADGKSLPAIDDPAVAVTLPTVSGVTFSSVTLDRLADDAAGNKVYKSVFTGTETATSKSISVTFYHSPTAADNSTYKGLMQATMPHTSTMGGTVYHRGISMIYEKNAASTMFVLESAANRSSDDTDFFSTTTGRIDFTKAAFGEDGVRFHAVVDNTTKGWQANYSWQAGSTDTRVRSFAIKTTGYGAGATGIAYFGFGGDIKNLTDANFYTAGITGINCNWINGVTSSTHTAKVQKQTLTFNTTAGEFQPGTNNITFAPSDNCSSTVAFTYSGATKPSYLTSPSAAVTNDLVATTAISTDIGTLTAPAFTMPSS